MTDDMEWELFCVQMRSTVLAPVVHAETSALQTTVRASEEEAEEDERDSSETPTKGDTQEDFTIPEEWDDPEDSFQQFQNAWRGRS